MDEKQKPNTKDRVSTLMGASFEDWFELLKSTRAVRSNLAMNPVQIPKAKGDEFWFLVDIIARLGLSITELHKRLDELEQSQSR